MSIEGQGHFFTIYFPGFVCFVLYLDKISGEHLQDHWSSGLDLNLSIHYDIVSTKIYVKWNDFNFDIVNFPFLDGDVPQRLSYGVYIYLNLFALPEQLRMLLTSIIVTNSERPNFLSTAIGIINSAKHFPNFIVGTLN